MKKIFIMLLLLQQFHVVVSCLGVADLYACGAVLCNAGKRRR